MRTVLIDGNSIASRAIYQAAYIVKDSANLRSVATRALPIFDKFIKTFTKGFDKALVAWDVTSGSNTFRGGIYDNYKSNRQSMNFSPILDLFEQYVSALGIQSLGVYGFEADDVLGTASLFLPGEIEIVTSDKDILQLVTDDVWVRRVIQGTTNSKIYTPAVFKEEYGFGPEKFAFYKALIGDSSDNYPGIKGIGPKGGQVLVNEFKSMDDLYQNIAPDNKLYNKVIDGKDDAYMSLALSTILTTSIEIEEQLDEMDLSVVEADTSKIKEVVSAANKLPMDSL